MNNKSNLQKLYKDGWNSDLTDPEIQKFLRVAE